MNTSLSQCKQNLLQIMNSLHFTELPQLYDDASLCRFPALKNVLDGLDQRMKELEDFWNYLDNYRDSHLIAMVGPVNAGKSSLGNQLLGRDEFSVACVRETTCAQMTLWTDHTFLVDLPGLGSILSKEDDAEVRKWMRRANVVLLVTSTQQPISRDFYDFLKMEIPQSPITQRVIIVINKLDTLGDLPAALRQRQIDQIEEFLLRGSPKGGFRGIAELFPFEVPCLAISTTQALQANRLDDLRHAIQEARNASNDGGLECGRRVLKDISDWLEPILITATKLSEESDRFMSDTVSAYNNLIESIVDYTNTKFDGCCAELLSSFDAGITSMRGAECTNIWQQIGTTDSPEYMRKMNLLKELRDQAILNSWGVFDRFTATLTSDFHTMCNARFGITPSIELPQGDNVRGWIMGFLSHVWEYLDMLMIRGISQTDTLSEAYEQGRLSSVDGIDKALNAWVSSFFEAIDVALDDALEDYTSGSEIARLNEWGSVLETPSQQIRAFRREVERTGIY